MPAGIAPAVLSAFLRAVGTAVVTNGIADGSVKALTDLGASLIDRGSEATEELQKLTLKIEQLIAENREPNQDEWNELSMRSQQASNIIQAWRPATS